MQKTEEEMGMTDFQMKTIFRLVVERLEEAVVDDDPEKTLTNLKKLIEKYKKMSE